MFNETSEEMEEKRISLLKEIFRSTGEKVHVQSQTMKSA